jgi:hypothetical protein
VDLNRATYHLLGQNVDFFASCWCHALHI